MIGITEKALTVSSKPTVFSESQDFEVSFSSIIIEIMAARRKASDPGFTGSQKSAKSAVSVRRGSITTIERLVSAEISLNPKSKALQYAENVEGPIKVTLYFFCISEIHNSFFSVICVFNSK